MKYFSLLLAAAACTLAVSPVQGQEWRPPSRQMPRMPGMASLRGDWRAAAGPWADGVIRVSGTPAAEIRAAGETTPGGAQARFVRFLAGHLPLATWSDRNGDGTADMVELFHDGTLVQQVIDADYDGSANVLRVYNAKGELVREERM
jgi:hypothetical protein